MNPIELRKRGATLLGEARQIIDAAKALNRDLTAEERQAIDEKMAASKQLFADAARIEAIDEARRTATQPVETRQGDPLPHNDPANTDHGRHTYSVLRALRSQLPNADRISGLELEVHQELLKRRNSSNPAKGILVPWDLTVERRATGVLDTTAGTGTIPTILDKTMIDILRARLVVVSMGATVMNDMQGLFAIPRQNQAATAAWVGEGTAPATSNQTADQVPFTPKTVGTYTDYTRRFLEQTNQDAETMVKNDLVAVIARAVDAAAINGSGATNYPKGIMSRTGDTPPVGLVACGTTGGNPTWPNLVGLESAVAIANADMGRLGYVTNAAVRGYMKQTPKIGTTYPVMMWADGTTPVNGYPAGVSNLVPSNLTKSTGTGLSGILFGNWEDLVIVFWSGIDLLVDPYTGGNAGTVRINGLQDCDLNLRHPESFAVILDAKTS